MNYESTIQPDYDADDNPLLDREEDRRSRRNLIVSGVLLLILLVGIGYFLSRDGGAAADGDKKTQTPVVSVISPGRGTIEGTITATGTLAARRELPIGIAGEGGQVVAVLVEPGQWVRAGQVLAIVDRTVQIAQASGQAAQIQVARANADLAEANYQRALKLVAKGFVSKADIDRLRATRDGAFAQVRVASAQSGVISAQMRRLNVVAPAAGLVLERKIEPGQIVSAGSGVLFRLAQGGEMELKAQLGEVEMAKLAPGVSATVVPVGTDKLFVGQVWQLSPVIDPVSRQGTARIALAYAPELRPGGFATATIKSGAIVAPLLPESAILSDNQGNYVYIVDKDNKARRRPVKTGMVTEKGVAVIEGLDGSERVVLRAGGFLQPDESVQPRPVKVG